jgi:TetR/AcrR family transcriptional regulator, acrAB operon repressor
MARKTKEDALTTRAQLLDAAQRLFCERGVSHTSLHEIAREAGLTRGAIYWHFENKEDLLAALWERVSLPMELTREEIEVRYANDPLARLYHTLLAVAEHVVSDESARSFMSIILLKCEYVAETEAVRQHFVAAREHCLSRSKADFQAAIDSAQLPAYLDPENTALGLFSLFDGACFHWLLEPTRFKLLDVLTPALHAYLQGLKTNLPPQI